MRCSCTVPYGDYGTGSGEANAFAHTLDVDILVNEPHLQRRYLAVMPGDRNLTLAYAGVASLAAITLVYVFSPSFAIDSNNTSSSQRQKGVVGLVNTANDCFVSPSLVVFGSCAQMLNLGPRPRSTLPSRHLQVFLSFGNISSTEAVLQKKQVNSPISHFCQGR